MVQSMTGFARIEKQTAWGHFIWECRSVNHRYFDFKMRLPESFRSLEGDFTEKARKILQRGKIDCSLTFQQNQANDMQLNKDAFEQLLNLQSQISEIDKDIKPLTVNDCIKFPGVLESNTAHSKDVESDIMEGFVELINELQVVRQREGDTIKAFFEQRLQGMSEQITNIQPLLSDLTKQLRTKLIGRLEELEVKVDEGRLEQEVVLLAQKADVCEEVQRLEAHIAEVGRVLKSEKLVGRRLDFLMQEFNREANTLASKSTDLNLTQCAVELKVLIEQMREQVQNCL